MQSKCALKMRLKYHEHHCPFYDLKTVKFRKTACLHSSLCSYEFLGVLHPAVNAEPLYSHEGSNPPTADTSCSGPCQPIMDTEGEISSLKRVKLLQIKFEANFL